MSEAVTLRHCGPSHYAHPEIARRAEADLGFEVEIIEESDAGLIERAINRPETLNVYEHTFTLDLVEDALCVQCRLPETRVLTPGLHVLA